MKSIMHDGEACFLCGRNGYADPLDWHHIFGGANRKLSEKYGLKVRLCHGRCHENGKAAVHKNKAVNDELKAKGQAAFEEAHPDLDFLSIFGKNYIY